MFVRQWTLSSALQILLSSYVLSNSMLQTVAMLQAVLQSDQKEATVQNATTIIITAYTIHNTKLCVHSKPVVTVTLTTPLNCTYMLRISKYKHSSPVNVENIRFGHTMALEIALMYRDIL